MGKTLVAYFSKTGTTAEVAAEIGKVLSEKGRAVEVAEASSVAELSAYDAVAFGAPVNGMRIVPEAAAWAAAHAGELKKLPHAYFALTYMVNEGRPLWRKAIKKCFDLPEFATGPRALAWFAGRVREPLPGFARLIFGLRAGLPADLRDWEAIRAWAAELDRKLG